MRGSVYDTLLSPPTLSEGRGLSPPVGFLGGSPQGAEIVNFPILGTVADMVVVVMVMMVDVVIE